MSCRGPQRGEYQTGDQSVNNAIDDVGAARSARTMAVEVLDRCYVSPGNLVDGDLKHGCNFLPFERAWRPAAQGDRGDAALVEAATVGEFGDIDRLLSTEFGDGTRHDKQEVGRLRLIPSQPAIKKLRFLAIAGQLASWLRLPELYRILGASIIFIDGI
jgi:hypothetical protein